MKKILLITIITFSFLSTVNAQTTEEKITELKNNVNQLSEKLIKNENDRLDKTYPIGSIYKTTTYSTKEAVETNIGGVWEAYSSGRLLIGVDPNDSNFNTVNKTEGTSTVTLAASNIPSHNHGIPTLYGTAANAGAHNHSFNNGIAIYKVGGGARLTTGTATYYASFSWISKSPVTGSAGTHSHSVSANASNSGYAGSTPSSFTNLPPYITVYMYKRIG